MAQAKGKNRGAKQGTGKGQAQQTRTAEPVREGRTAGPPSGSAAPEKPVTGHYLRIEGVNLGACIYDTNQLSVVRGASLLLRQAARDSAEQIAQSGQAVSTGASIGEYRLATKDPEEARRIADEVALGLSRGNHAHLTFAVALEPTRQDLPAAMVRERALARIRFEQLRMPALVPPPHNTDMQIGACGWEGRRPADSNRPVKRPEDDEPTWLSCSVRDRYDYGRNQKHLFYCEETGIEADAQGYTNELGEIARLRRARNLDGKIAVIYADGNRFSKIRDLSCPEFKELAQFDETIQGNRKAFLRDLVERLGPGGNLASDQGPRRIETLLWGGDEFTLVVPAWRGFDVLQLFFAASAHWRFPETGRDFQRLTHAAGIVFCRAKTPIQRTAALARALADRVKARLKSATSGNDEAAFRASLQNAWDYAVLESVDFPTEPDLDRYFTDRYHQAARCRGLCKPLSGWLAGGAAATGAVTRADIARLLEALPKGQVYAVARAAAASDTDWSNPQGIESGRERSDKALTDLPGIQPFLERYDRMRQVIGETEFGPLAAQVQALFGSTGTIRTEHCAVPVPDPWPWIHLAELWDYLAPGITPTAGQGGGA